MYTKLILFRNELKNKQVYTYKLVGMTSELIFSKEIFPRNKDIAIFLNEVFDVTYKDYVMKSRTIIAAKSSKLLYTSDQQLMYSKKLLTFVNEAIDKFKKLDNINNKNNFDGWIK